MKRRIQEEKERIISLFGINEDVEMKPEVSLKDKLDLIKFNNKKGGEVEITFDDIDDISRDMEHFTKMGDNPDTALIKAVIASKGNKKEEYLIVGGSFPSNIFSVTFDEDTTFGDYDGNNKFDYFKVESLGDNDRHFSLVRVNSDELVSNEKGEEESVEKETEIQEPVQQEPEQPFEEEMKQKEKKGLASLLDGNTEDTSNNFTKRQKKVLEKLKGEGYLLNRPENEEGYTRKKVTSKEFTESFNVWEPKK
jgi:hypothetical protein